MVMYLYSAFTFPLLDTVFSDNWRISDRTCAVKLMSHFTTGGCTSSVCLSYGSFHFLLNCCSNSCKSILQRNINRHYIKFYLNLSVRTATYRIALTVMLLNWVKFFLIRFPYSAFRILFPKVFNNIVNVFFSTVLSGLRALRRQPHFCFQSSQ